MANARELRRTIGIVLAILVVIDLIAIGLLFSPLADRRKREAMLHQIQQLVYDRVRFGPLYEFIWPSGIGPRVAEPALLLIDPYPWSAPYEEVRLKGRGGAR